MQHEVENMLKYLNTAKASVSDGVPPYFVKHCSASLAPTLILITNGSLATRIVPDVFKVANACPLFKNGDPYNARNYRPISFLPIISKLLEKVVRRQPVKHLQLSTNPLDFQQSSLPTEAIAPAKMHLLWFSTTCNSCYMSAASVGLSLPT